MRRHDGKQNLIRENMLLLDKIVVAFRALGIRVSEDQLRASSNLIRTSVSSHDSSEPIVASAPPPVGGKAKHEKDPNRATGAVNAAAATNNNSNSIITLPKEAVTLSAFLDFFTVIYTPAYKFGEELRTMAGRGVIDRLTELVDSGCDPNAKDGAGWTALHHAAEHGVLHAVNALACTSLTPLDFNARDVSGWTPLMCAAANGHVATILRLVGTTNVVVNHSVFEHTVSWCVCVSTAYDVDAI
jgi:hypothetical protein